MLEKYSKIQIFFSKSNFSPVGCNFAFLMSFLINKVDVFVIKTESIRFQDI